MYLVVINNVEAKLGFWTSTHSEKEAADNKADYHRSIGHDVRGVYKCGELECQLF